MYRQLDGNQAFKGCFFFKGFFTDEWTDINVLLLTDEIPDRMLSGSKVELYDLFAA